MRPSLLTWLCTSLSAGFASVWWSFLALLPNPVLQALLAPFLRLPILAEWSFPRSLTTFSLKLAGSRSATCNLATLLPSARGRHSLHLATELLSARGRAPTKSGLCCESSPGSSVLLMARVLQLHNGVLCNLDLFLKLRFVEEIPGCRHFIGDVSRVQLLV